MLGLFCGAGYHDLRRFAVCIRLIISDCRDGWRDGEASWWFSVVWDSTLTLLIEWQEKRLTQINPCSLLQRLCSVSSDGRNGSGTGKLGFRSWNGSGRGDDGIRQCSCLVFMVIIARLLTDYGDESEINEIKFVTPVDCNVYAVADWSCRWIRAGLWDRVCHTCSISALCHWTDTRSLSLCVDCYHSADCQLYAHYILEFDRIGYPCTC